MDALSGKPTMMDRTITFPVDGSECKPNVFCDENGEYFDFELTMRCLAPEDELAVLERVTNGAVAPILLAKAMLHKMNGRLITLAQREWLWTALDMKGRNLCFVAYQMIGGASARSLGKFHAGCSIG
jgi:hypothetical protein